MTTEPRWFSQPYPPEGASAAEGIRNQLGRPELDLLTILVRESAQNSWDARLQQSSTPVDYRIDMWTVSPAHAGAWRGLLLAGAPNSAEEFPLRETLRGGSLRVLSVSDRGTRGLGGPTRADNAVGPDRDFVSFIRNIGEPRDTALGGGTYGFGKGIFYLLSKPGTVVVHSRCRTVEGGFETRLIGCTLWKSYVAAEPGGDRRYTGRHWWGDTSGEVVEPLVGAAAEAVAQRLGLKAFGPEETGTTVVVVDPKLDDLEPAEAAAYLGDTIVWHLWPKMISTDGAPPAMRFSVTCDGVGHAVPDPRETRPLNMFVAAYETMVGPNGSDLECLRPKRHLGRLGLVKRIMPPLEPTRASRMLDIEDLIHHVCLMRPAELVVAYHPGPKPPSTSQGYAGVFRAEEAMDEVYAKAEPPRTTHGIPSPSRGPKAPSCTRLSGASTTPWSTCCRLVALHVLEQAMLRWAQRVHCSPDWWVEPGALAEQPPTPNPAAPSRGRPRRTRRKTSRIGQSSAVRPRRHLSTCQWAIARRLPTTGTPCLTTQQVLVQRRHAAVLACSTSAIRTTTTAETPPY